MARFRRVFELISGRGRKPQRLLDDFGRHRQELQQSCLAIASAAGKPRGLKWSKCVWLETLALVEEPSTGIVTLFCGVNLSFEAIEGGDMEDVEAVSMVRDATAVFHHQNQRWGTGGRVLFNMSPEMAAKTVTPDQSLLLLRG